MTKTIYLHQLARAMAATLHVPAPLQLISDGQDITLISKYGRNTCFRLRADHVMVYKPSHTRFGLAAMMDCLLYYEDPALLECMQERVDCWAFRRRWYHIFSGIVSCVAASVKNTRDLRNELEGKQNQGKPWDQMQ